MRPTHTPFRRAVARLCLAAFAATLPGAPAAAELVGEQVVSGDVSIDRAGDVTTIHASDGAIIEYEGFSVWSHEQLHFVQPHDQARVMNRVRGDDPTHIDGGLFANGIVYIVNPAGIFVGAGAVVDVGGLYAAAGHIQDEDFHAGIDAFELSGVVENAGRIEAPEVALLGRAVANHGEIHAPDGTIALVAGERVLLTRLAGHLHVQVDGPAGGPDAPAIEQTGTVDAGTGGAVSFTTGDVYSLALNHEGITRGGRIELRAATGLLRVAGLLDASNAAPGSLGGEIDVTGEQVALLGALLDASGDGGGGTIRVGGDLRGGGVLPNAKRTFVDEESVLRADAGTAGDGGTVVVYADEATAFHGAISARGGAEGGDGGFAEISGAVFLFSGGDVDLRAVQGANGTLLYDPKDIVIAGGVDDGDDAPDLQSDRLEMASLGRVLFGEPDELASPFTVYESEIEGTQANIVLEATHSITTTGAGTFTNDASGEGVDVLRIADGFSVTMRTRNLPGDEVDGIGGPGIDLTGISIQTSGGGDILLETGTGDPAGLPDPTLLGGDLAVADLTTRGGAGEDAGDVTVAVHGTGAIAIGAVDARGGDAAAPDGDGGDGGRVDIRNRGVAVDIGGTVADTRGGGDVTIGGAIDTRGGAGGADGVGGRGGAVVLGSADGAVSALAGITTSGGFGGERGGAAGTIDVAATDADQSGESAPDNDVALGSLTATGGGSSAGPGGAGGRTNVDTFLSREIEDVDGNVLQEALGGGSISIASVDTSGGDGGTSGGRAGRVTVNTRGSGKALQIGGDARATGGDGGAVADPDAFDPLRANDGGSGGIVNLSTQDGDLVLGGGLDTRGGAGGTDDALGGFGGSIRLTTGFEFSDSGSIQLGGTLDAREGAHGANVGVDDPDDPFANRIVELESRDGGTITVDAVGDVMHDGSAGPHVRTTGDVNLAAGGDLGSVASPFRVEGSDERRLDAATGTRFVDHDTLAVSVGGVGRVEVLAGARFLDALDVGARSADADVLVTQPGAGAGDRVELLGDGVSQVRVVDADSTDNQIDLAVRFENHDETAPDGTLVLPTGAVTLGGDFAAWSAGDLVVGDAASSPANPVLTASAVAAPDAMPGDPLVAGNIALLADAQQGRADDGTGALIDAPGAAVGVIDLLPGGADEPGALAVFAAEGVGTPGEPITVSGGGRVAGVNAPQIPDPDNEGQFLPDPDATSGIHLRNVGSGDLRVAEFRLAAPLIFPQLENRAGSGEIAVTNEVGDVIVEAPIDNRPTQPDPDDPDAIDSGPGGAVTLTPGPGGRVVLDHAGLLGAMSGGLLSFGGDVVLAQSFGFQAYGGLEVLGTIDTQDTAAEEASFSGLAGAASRLAGDVGANRPLSIFAISAADPDAPPALTLDLASVTTTGAQIFDLDVLVARDATLRGSSVSIGALDAAPAAVSSNVAFAADSFVQFTGDVGASQPVSGLDVDAREIAFNGEGTQTVSVGTGGIRLGRDVASDPISPVATIGRLRDDLRLSTTGDLSIGDGHKLSVPGSLTLVGDRVRVTDLSALDLDVQANTFEVFARAEGPVLLANGGQVTDLGTDILANTVSFSTAPVVVGGGTAPRIATLSGSAGNPGPLQVTRLERAITSADIATQVSIFDLAIPLPDPGLETPEPPAEPVEVPLGLTPSDDASEPALPSAIEVVAWLACAPVGDDDTPAGCAPVAAPPAGSALDTERAGEVAADRRWLLGPSKRAAAGRVALARTGDDPGASLADTSPAGRAYLARSARLLAQARMLGLGAERYGEVRGALLAELVAAIGSPEVDPERLLAGIEAYAMGMEI